MNFLSNNDEIICFSKVICEFLRNQLANIYYITKVELNSIRTQDLCFLSFKIHISI